MSSLTSRLKTAAARLMGTPAAREPEPYELQCDCGHRVHGIRRTTAIQAECSACASSLFVLPVDVYPEVPRLRTAEPPLTARPRPEPEDTTEAEPAEPARERTREKRAAGARREADAESGTDRNDQDQRARQRGVTDRATGSTDRRGRVEEPPRSEPEPIPEGAVKLPRVAATVRVRRVVTPFRVLMLAGVALIAATGWWMMHQRQLGDARKTWRKEMDAAETALEDGDANALRAALEKAVAAATVLQRDDAEARRAVMLLKQSIAVAELSQLDIVDQLRKAQPLQGTPPDSPLAIERVAALEGQWFVFDCPLARAPTGNTAVIANLLLIVNETPVVVFCSSPLLHRYVQTHRNLPAVFAARILRCERTGGDRPEWSVELDGESVCLITTERHAEWIGYDIASVPELSAAIARQAEFVEQADGSDAAADATAGIRAFHDSASGDPIGLTSATRLLTASRPETPQ